MNELVKNRIIGKGNESYDVVQTIWEQFTFWMIVLLVVGLLWESVSGVWKSIRNNKHN